ncbi:PTS sugar transporter subunit IIA [Allofustis seminis]|uniref:PTS sugar transporter subunit IIA n=1 Tax=Allofustis seminis TaxID=166939 RepID=UPI000376B0EF|nr:PTS sugar transporter subunit IIA [Allofustis seminis]
MIETWINKEFITLNLDVKTPREAIEMASEPLVVAGRIELEYINEMLMNYKEAGPYFVLMPNVAIPHAQAESWVRQNSIAISRLKTPVYFGNKANDPVKYVFILAAVKGEDHLKALSFLSILLDDKKFFEKLEDAKNPDEIITYIDSKRKEALENV